MQFLIQFVRGYESRGYSTATSEYPKLCRAYSLMQVSSMREITLSLLMPVLFFQIAIIQVVMLPPLLSKNLFESYLVIANRIVKLLQRVK